MNTKFSITITLILLCLGACNHDQEMPNGDPINMRRFTFPQGDSPTDHEIALVSQKFDCQIIYKDFKGADIAKSWIAPSSGTIYLTTPTGDEGLKEMFNIFKSSILESLSEKLAQKALPLYIYLCDTLVSAQRTINEDGETILSYKRDIPYSFSGQDYWAFCISPSERHDDSKVMTYSAQVKLNLFNKLENNGHITIPEEFNSLSDYETPTNSFKTTDPNYYKKRGFIDKLKDSFTGRPQRFMLYLTKRGRNADFLMYVKALIYYSPEEFEQIYPKESYPLIHKKMAYVEQALKSQGLVLKRK